VHAGQQAASQDDRGPDQRRQHVLVAEPLLALRAFEVIAHQRIADRKDRGFRHADDHAAGDDRQQAVEHQRRKAQQRERE
jgi:hypothetical protein